ncbi:MAG: hypothetical protein ACTSQB_04635 [Candidatus Heimdallarchaeota archaeon]
MAQKRNISKQGNASPQSKVITIRDLDKELFEDFVSLTRTWGKNTGTIFANILSNFLEYGGSNIFLPTFEKRLALLDCKHLEIIDNLDELSIRKKDLTSLPEVVKFFINTIGNLSFAADIDTSTLLKYIYRIRNTNVNQPTKVGKIPFLSLLHNYSKFHEGHREVKDVTIRNVLEQTWNEFIAASQVNNSAVRLMINQILWEVIPEMELTQILLSKVKESQANIYTISSQKTVTITKADLESIDTKKVLFHRIDELIFRNDITNKIFVEKVVGIYNCKKVVFPTTFSKLLRLSRVFEYPSTNF